MGWWQGVVQRVVHTPGVIPVKQQDVVKAVFNTKCFKAETHRASSAHGLPAASERIAVVQQLNHLTMGHMLHTSARIIGCPIERPRRESS